jgi:ADP-ribosylglycohydrolase
MMTDDFIMTFAIADGLLPGSEEIATWEVFCK